MPSTDIEASFPLIETKLHRPPLPVDLVLRPRLTEWLKKRLERPLTLVSAPAGYGKSTLISCWLEQVDRPVTWVSLDERDNELPVFLTYLVAAIVAIFPGELSETQALLLRSTVMPIQAIARVLINEISRLQRPFILVLDDYHQIVSQPIHELINELLSHPPANLHLVLGTRMDPPLSLVTLRAKSQVTEIRVQDLRFQQQESYLLFQKMIDVSVDPAVVREAELGAEGWVTGLRLAALAMRHRIGQGTIEGNLALHNLYVVEYLLSEILAKQAALMTECLLNISILERFCAGLCEAICSSAEGPEDNESAQPDFSGKQFLDWLKVSNLFVVPLDANFEWFRFHHLFREFLLHELARRRSDVEIEKLHAAAGRWYADNGWIEEALDHYLTAKNHAAAIQLVANHRYSLMNATQWPQLERWLDLFPTDIIETSAELWMLKTWLTYHRGQFSELGLLIRRLSDLITSNREQHTDSALQGEINTLLSLITYHASDTQASLIYAQKALEQLPSELWIVRVLARMYLSGNLLAHGDPYAANLAIYGAFEEEKVQSKQFIGTLLVTACNVHWIAADLISMEQAARRSIALSRATGLQQILDYASYHLGKVHYQHNELGAAEELFAGVVARPYLNYGTSYASSVCGLALTFQAQGKSAKANEIVQAAVDFLLETGNTTQLPLILALQAELALKQGQLPVARQWAEKLNPVPSLAPMFEFLSGHLTLVRVWLAQNTPASLEKAEGLLESLEEYLENNHNTRFLIETFSLQAILMQAQGNRSFALGALERGLRLAQPGGFIRLFVDADEPIRELLIQLRANEELGAYCEQILAAFPVSRWQPAFSHEMSLEEPLTSREMEILELLQERLSNKEIARRLMITTGTVKGHTINIYQKLGVNGRRQAVEKAVVLGILPAG